MLTTTSKHLNIMRKVLLFILTAILTGCMSSEERAIKNFINSKLSGNADKVTDVEILGTDSVLSLMPLGLMYNGCLAGNSNSRVEIAEYFADVVNIRTNMRLGKEPEKDSISFPEWRRIVKVKATAGGKTNSDIEVIFDNDGITPYMLGRDYDEDLNMWDLKIQSLPN